MSNFNIGDKVYFPEESTKVLTVCANSRSPRNYDTENYPLDVNGYSVTLDGKIWVSKNLPCIFHATAENQAKLEALYGIEFEAPPVKPTPKEIIQAMLDKGEKYVLCLVADNPQQITEGNGVPTAVVAVDDGSKFCFHTASYYWQYAIPIDSQGNEITELPT